MWVSWPCGLVNGLVCLWCSVVYPMLHGAKQAQTRKNKTRPDETRQDEENERMRKRRRKRRRQRTEERKREENKKKKKKKKKNKKKNNNNKLLEPSLAMIEHFLWPTRTLAKTLKAFVEQALEPVAI